MNCDQVFQVLTRSSFPASESTDSAVEAHLRTCFDCRSMAEALRPALDLFHEAMSPHDRQGLPVYHGNCAAANCERNLPATIDALIDRVMIEEGAPAKGFIDSRRPLGLAPAPSRRGAAIEKAADALGSGFGE